ncbi:hypothetical protein PG984_000225 [Apiospora sp. TS-2023a]
MEHSSAEFGGSRLSLDTGQRLLQYNPRETPAPHESLHSNNSSNEKEFKKIRKRSPYTWPLLWSMELASWLGSVCCFIAIVVVLATLDAKEPPSWYLTITPNAVIQLLATVSQALLMVSVSSGIGQTKWLRMLRECRPMVDFHLLDQSSRGPWGSLLLLVNRRGGSVASLGALITILSLGIATCFQQTLRYHTVYSDGNDASVPIAQYMNGSDTVTIAPQETQEPQLTLEGIDGQLRTAPYIALFSPPHTRFTATAHCATGNCTWKPYETLAICNTCKELSSTLQTRHDESGSNILFTLPNGFGLIEQNSIGLLNFTTSSSDKARVAYRNDPWGSIAFDTNSSQLFSVFAVGAPPGTVPGQPDPCCPSPSDPSFAPPVAYECLLYYCINEMRASWSNSTFYEEVVSSWTNHTQGCPESFCPSPFTFTSPKSGTTFHIHEDTLTTAKFWLSHFLNGTATAHGYYGLNYTTFSSDFSSAIYKAMYNSTTGFTGLMDNLANRLSLSLREIPGQPLAVGQSFAASYIAFVRWGWLTLPAFELIASLIFLVAVIAETKKQDLAPWRNGILATFFHGFDHRPIMAQDGGHSLEDESRHMLVEFRQDGEGGGRLVSTTRAVV